jgi:IgA peptidase M64
VLAAGKEALPLAARDTFAVLVNDDQEAGTETEPEGQTFIVSSTDASMEATVVHELGHSVGGLADEYEEGECELYEPLQENIARDDGTFGTPPSWEHWIDRAIPSATPREGCPERMRARAIARPTCLASASTARPTTRSCVVACGTTRSTR